MSLIATSSADLKFHCWSDGNIKDTYEPSNHTAGPIKSLSWGKDGSWVVMVPSAGAAEVISIRDNLKVLHTIYDVQQPSCAVFQNSTKKNIAIGTSTGQVLVYDIKARSIRKRFPKTSSGIFQLQYNAKDSHIAAACRNGEILLYSSVTANISSTYKVPDSEMVSTVSFHSNCKNFLSAGSTDGIVAVWDINTNQIKLNANAHLAAVSGIAFSPSRLDLLVSAGMDRRFLFLDISQKKTVFELEVQCSVTALDFSPCGTYLAAGSQLGDVTVYDTRQLSQPCSHFVAHENKKIFHVLFQKFLNQVDDDVSLLNISVDQTDNSKVQNDNDNSNVEPLWGMITDDTIAEKDVTKQSVTSQEEDDSFLAAFGIESFNTQYTKRESALGVSIGTETMKSEHRRESEGGPVTNLKNFNTSYFSAPTSTPTYVKGEALQTDLVFSPIITSNETLNAKQLNKDDFEQLKTNMRSIIKEEVRNIVREEVGSLVKEEIGNIVKEEIKQQFNELKTDLQYQYLDVIGDSRSHFIELHSFLVGQFVELNYRLKEAGGEMPAENFGGSDLLLLEFTRMRREIEKIKEKVVEKVV